MKKTFLILTLLFVFGLAAIFLPKTIPSVDIVLAFLGLILVSDKMIIAWKCLLILIGAQYAIRLVKKKIRYKTFLSNVERESQHVVKTMIPVVRSTLIGGIWLFGIIMFFDQIGFDILPALYSLGAVSVGVGMAFKDFVKDLVKGFSCLIDGTIHVNDTIKVCGTQGIVEDLTLRHIKLRSNDGALHTINFSSMGAITNYSRDYSIFTFQHTLAHQDDLKGFQKTFETVLKNVKKSKQLGEKLISDKIEELKIGSYSAEGLSLTASIKIKPQSDDLESELKSRIHNTFYS